MTKYILKIALKFLHSYRLLLAAMHYNENAIRPLAFTKKNEQRFAVAFSRSTYGEPFLRQEKADPTYSKSMNSPYLLLDKPEYWRHPVCGKTDFFFLNDVNNSLIMEYHKRFLYANACNLYHLCM